MGRRKGWRKLVARPEEDEAWAYYCLAGCGGRLARAKLGPELPQLMAMSPTTSRFELTLERGFRLDSDGRYYRTRREADRQRWKMLGRIERIIRNPARLFQPFGLVTPFDFARKGRPLSTTLTGRVWLLRGTTTVVVCPKCGVENSVSDPV